MNEEPGIDIENLGDVRWHLCLCLVLAWILVIIFVSRGIQSTGKVIIRLHIDVQYSSWNYLSVLYSHNLIINTRSHYYFSVRNCLTWPGRIFSARQHMPSALYAIARPSVHTGTWIRQKRLKLVSCNFHHTVAPYL